MARRSLLTKDLNASRWTYQTGQEPIERGTVIDLMVRRDAISLDDCVNRMAACLDPSQRTGEPAAYREAQADRDNTLRKAVARHISVMTAERDSERGLEHLGVVRGSFDSWRFGPASAVLHDPADLGHSRYRAGDRAMVFVEATDRRHRLRARPRQAARDVRLHGRQPLRRGEAEDRPHHCERAGQPDRHRRSV